MAIKSFDEFKKSEAFSEFSEGKSSNDLEGLLELLQVYHNWLKDQIVTQPAKFR